MEPFRELEPFHEVEPFQVARGGARRLRRPRRMLALLAATPVPGFRVSGFGFWVSGFGFWVSGFGLRIEGAGLLRWRQVMGPQSLTSSRDLIYLLRPASGCDWSHLFESVRSNRLDCLAVVPLGMQDPHGGFERWRGTSKTPIRRWSRSPHFGGESDNCLPERTRR